MRNFYKSFKIITLILLLLVITFTGKYLFDTQQILNQIKIEKEQSEKVILQTKIKTLEANLKETHENIEKIIKVDEGQLQLLDALGKEIIDVGKEVIKPQYDYLKSVTVYIQGEIPSKVNEDNSIRVRQAWAGTGSIIKIDNDYTYILTNAHVTGQGLEPEDEIILNIKEGTEKIPAELVKRSNIYDLAIIKVKGKINNKQAIKGFGSVKQQDKIFSCGQYLGMEFIYTEGTVAGYTNEERFDDKEALIVNMPSAFGCSGSIVLNKDGEAVGVVYAIFNVGMFSPDTSKAICIKGENTKNFVEEVLGGI